MNVMTTVEPPNECTCCRDLFGYDNSGDLDF